MRAYAIPLINTRQIHPLASAYIQAKPEICNLYQWPLDISAMEDAIHQRQTKFPVDRQRLADSLRRQYQAMQPDFFELEDNRQVGTRIENLLSENCFTITTGHQLNIFTGPLFFIYKIVSAIKYAAQLKVKYPQYDFVPVYWMASEDHDFEEISNFHLFGRTYTWDKPGNGAVGRLNPKSLSGIIRQLEDLLEGRTNAAELLALFKQAYLEQPTLSLATRKLVHELFKEEGLVIMDADDAQLKQTLTPIIREDIFNQTFHQLISDTAASLTEQYKVVVTPRPINVFYLENGQRNRIVQEEGLYCVMGRNKCWTAENLEAEIQTQPGNFSPNVVLRPMYQELILPNLAYIGGNNEIAYWLELKAAFDKAGVFFPQLIVRDSALWIGKKGAKDFQALNIEPEDTFDGLQEFKNRFYAHNNLEHPAEAEIEALQQQFQKVRESLQGLPSDLVAPVVKDLNTYAKEAKKWKADVHKKQLEQEEKNIQKLEKLYQAIFPEGEFQERYDNFIAWHLQYGKEMLRILKDSFCPLDAELHILVE